MIYKQQQPIPELKHIVKCFWLIDSDGASTINTEKIIPDGYPECIFHYKNPFRVNISGSWKMQELFLLAGQIKNHFFLQNTGTAAMFGIKFQPWALKRLFDIDMSTITNNVVEIPGAIQNILKPIIQIATSESSFIIKVNTIENWFLKNYSNNDSKSKGQKATELILQSKGETPISNILSTIGISERSLERYFKTYIGLSPKFYSRVIRFSNIFNLIQNPDFKWTDVSYLAGFYDQSHFIKNFKEFTGEEPSTYGFDEQNMANFFLNG